MFKNAIARNPGLNFANGLTTATSGIPSYELILKQHQAYLDTMRSLGLHIDLLDALPDFPDAYFVEDVAIVTAEIAVISRPGAASREGEIAHIVSALDKYRPLAWIQAPGTLDGGDVMITEDHCFIGLSERTNREGAAQLGAIMTKHGFSWTAVPLSGGLHLKSDVNYIGQKTLLLSKEMAEKDIFSQFNQIVVDARESHAANSLLVNGRLITPKGFPRTKAKLLAKGFDIIELNTSEVQKMDGGLSCMSLRF